MPRKETCIYCGRKQGVTDDHVPPKCFFADPCPNGVQRITVPCCENCRTADEKSESFVRNTLAALPETEAMPYVREHIEPRVRRSIGRARWESRRTINILRSKPVAILTESGLKTAFAPAYDLNIPEMDRFFERIARAALYATCDKPFFAAVFAWREISKTDVQPLSILLCLGEKRRVDHVFFYCLSQRINGFTYYVYAEFYQAIGFLIEVKEIVA